MTCSLAAAAVAMSMLMVAVLAPQAGATHLGTTYCGPTIPADEASGTVAFPRGDVFCPLFADPKTEGSFVSYLRGKSSSAFGTDIGAAGIGDRFGLVRWNGQTPGLGVELSLAANVYTQFDLNTPSYDLINADYVVGLPLTVRWNRFSARLRPYHQSSHLGDEYLLRPGTQRLNLSYQSIESILSMDLGPLRVYGGGEYLPSREPDSLEAGVVHAGAELRQRTELGHTGIRLIAGGDMKSAQELNWAVSWSVRAGFEVSRPGQEEHPVRRWTVVGEYYDGASPYGQFFRDDVSYYGVGIHFAPY